MINTKFEAYKIKRELKRSGIDYEFKRLSANDFGEPTGEPAIIGTLKGLYHVYNEQSGKIQITMSDTTQVRTKKVPMILCLYEDAANLFLRIGDIVKINEKTLRVTGITDVQEWNIISDISLEVIDDGIQA